MTTTTTKFQLGAAALAVGAAATLTPVVAQADTMSPLAPSLTSVSQGVGSGILSNIFKKPTAKVGATKATSIFQNKFLWLGTPNPTPPSPQVPVWTFKPLNAVAWVPFLGPGSAIWNWWNKQSSQTCIAGISTFVGPYGTTPDGNTPSAGSITHQWSPNGCA